MKPGKIIRSIAMLLSLLTLITSTVGTTYCYLVTKTDPITNVFLPSLAGGSGLTVEKTVEHPLGENYAIPEQIKFDFDVELGSFYANAKIKTNFGEMTADKNGRLSITVTPHVTFRMEDLEEGTVVRVTEKATSLKGFAVKGDAVKTVTVGSDGTASVSFVNIYTPDSVQPSKVTVGGIKILEGRDWRDGDEFTFVLEQKNGTAWTKLGERTVSYDAKNANFNRFDFSDLFGGLTFDGVGIYSFRMSEIVGDVDLDYDETINHFTVLVTDVDMDGALEINTVAGTENAAVTKTRDGYDVCVTFNNTFVPPVVVDPDPITVPIRVEKILTLMGDAVLGKDGFRFLLKNTATAEGLSATSDSNGAASFALTFTKADLGKTYTYQLSEVNLGIAGVTYDTDLHTVSITVSLDEQNRLVAALTMDGKTVDSLQATFENTYRVETPEVPPTADGNALFLWFGVMLLSGTVLVALMVYDRKRRII